MARRTTSMLGKLRAKFVLITMLLTGIVLLGVMGSTLFTTWSTQRSIIDEALERAIEADLDSVPTIGGMRGPRDDQRDNNLLAIAVDVSETGVVIRTGHSPIAINSSMLNEVIKQALASEDDSGVIRDLHIAWRRSSYRSVDSYLNLYDDDEEYASYDYDYTEVARIAIVDTTALDNALAGQIRVSIVIIAVALSALFVVALLLSAWALAPVKRAWDDQRRFVSDASHELKTPLSVIIANTDILKQDADLPEKDRRWVESTSDEAALMRSLVNDLLELARADESTSSGVMRREKVDFSDLVDSATLEFDAIAYERGCLIDAAIEPGIIVQGDPSWLTRMVKILIDNACKYARENTTIGVSLSRSSGKCVLSVTNQGNPIDSEDLAHIFDRFFRSDKARTRETGGFGLGLAIAKSLAESHGGSISATSSEVSGTTFTVVLPL